MRKHVIVHGRVQGVWFRDFTMRRARALGVRGWVRNLPDGTVESVGEADEPTLERWLAALREGPELARVDRLDLSDAADDDELEGFRVR